MGPHTQRWPSVSVEAAFIAGLRLVPGRPHFSAGVTALGTLPAEPLEIQVLDELRQRRLHGCWRWLAILPSFRGFSPSSRPICTCACDRWYRLRASTQALAESGRAFWSLPTLPSPANDDRRRSQPPRPSPPVPQFPAPPPAQCIGGATRPPLRRHDDQERKPACRDAALTGDERSATYRL
jgi:hypothetical protein